MFRLAAARRRLPFALLGLPVIVSIPPKSDSTDPSIPATPPTHHKLDSKGKRTQFVNPWPSFRENKFSFGSLYNVWHDWNSHPTPAPELLPQVVKPDWGLPASTSKGFGAAEGEEKRRQWKDDLKATWLGHACWLIEFPASSEGRGMRVLLDPVFSNRCSPSQWIGPKRVTKPPFKLEELPEVDAVIISHNHYDHLDVATLQHIYSSQEKGTVHFFAPLGNQIWFMNQGFRKEDITELDWWEERDLSITVPSGPGEQTTGHLRITCTPCQHFTGRSLTDRFETLWASWAISQLPSPGSSASFSPSVWFGGDTGYCSVGRGAETEKDLPVCPAFKEIGSKFGKFDLAMIPIGAYDPRWAMSPVHCNPEDAVEVHLDVRSKKSVGCHWGTWALTCEEMTEPPKRLKLALKAKGLPEEDFITINIGETLRVTPDKEEVGSK